MARSCRWHRSLVLLWVAAVASWPEPVSSQEPSTSRPALGVTLEGQWVLPVRQADAYTAAFDTLRALGARMAAERPAEGLLVTRRLPYRPDWPDRDELDLRPGYVPTEAEFHVFVPPDFEPARLIVGAVLWAKGTPVPLRPGSRKAQSTYYSQRRLGSFVAASVARTLGVNLVPLDADAAARAAQALKALPSGVTSACGTRAAPRAADPKALASQSRLVYEVRPEYPPDGLHRRVGGTVTFKAQLTEHGTLVDLERIAGVEEPNFVAASFGAAGLWRLRAPLVGGCPVRTPLTIEMSFSIGR